MKIWTKTQLLGCAALVCAAAAGSALAAPPPAKPKPPPMSKQAYEAAEKRIEAQGKVDAKACGKLKGNAKDICKAEAEGREEVALAALEADYQPSPETEQGAKEARAEADRAIALERCDNAKGKAKSACVKQAKGEYEAAIRLAKVEKVESINGQKARDERGRKQRVAAAASQTQAAAAKAAPAR